jgi:hypothetical protein
LNDQGEALVYLDGHYDLRLFDEGGVLIWQVNNFTFSSGVTPSPGLVQVGSAQATLDAVDGAAVLTATGLAPAGYRLLGLTTEITEDFGTSHGLTALAFGDAVVEDRYGVQTTLTVGAATREQDFHSDTELVTAVPYTLLVAAQGGLFDGAGQLTARLYWQFLGTSEPPGSNPFVLEYGSAEATLAAEDGASVLVAAGLAPANARLLGLTTTITADFGTSHGLTGLLLGDGVVSDRWGIQTALSATTASGQKDFHSDTQLIAPAGYTLLVTAQGGTFDATGQIHVTLYWSTLVPDAP